MPNAIFQALLNNSSDGGAVQSGSLAFQRQDSWVYFCQAGGEAAELPEGTTLIARLIGHRAEPRRVAAENEVAALDPGSRPRAT